MWTINTTRVDLQLSATAFANGRWPGMIKGWGLVKWRINGVYFRFAQHVRLE
jgi:hypothetical protein